MHVRNIVLAGLALATAFNPLAYRGQADAGAWEPIQATQAWNYDHYKVEKLAFAGNAEGPLSLGSHVVVAEPVETCQTNPCERYNVYFLKDGMRRLISNVPAEALSEGRYFANGEAFVYVDAADLENHTWDVVGVNPDTGEETTYADDFFMDGVVEMDVLVDGGMTYLNPTLNWNGHTGYSQATIYSYNKKADDMRVVTKHWILNHEDIQDTQDGRVLSRMVFPDGNKQLWIYDTSKDPVDMRAVPGTWTPPNEDIVGAHFREDGSVEYFQMYQRYVFDGTNAVAQGDHLTWYREGDDAFQVVNGRMAWLDSEDTLRVSDTDGTLNLGTIGYPQTFHLDADRLFYASENAGKMYEFGSGKTTDLSFAATDSLGSILVGTDASGRVWYRDTETGTQFSLGYGSRPTLADETHVYWRDGAGIYEATVAAGALIQASTARAVKMGGSASTYLVVDNIKHEIPNERVFASWFADWKEVETVSKSELAALAEGPKASYAPGSRLKIAGDPKMYMVGTDTKLHWITTQIIAEQVFGAVWNKGIIEINQLDLTELVLGQPILTERDAQTF
ncbi:hypothetical protein HY734_03415 [Candidatus Uhrbacteria bacterium]|nr:hypothetical protein [Candidatus Uhrbacteria bacterium]